MQPQIKFRKRKYILNTPQENKTNFYMDELFITYKTARTEK